MGSEGQSQPHIDIPNYLAMMDKDFLTWKVYQPQMRVRRDQLAIECIELVKVFIL